MIYALTPKNYTKYTNYIMQKTKRKKIRNQILKLFNYKDLLTRKKNLNLQKQSNKFCKKPKENVCLLPLYDLSKLFFPFSLKKI